MRNYNRDRRPKKRDFGGRGDFGKPEMHDAVCDECGRKCKVPFKPTGGKPVFCDDCFKGASRSSKGRDRGRDDKNLQEQVDVINSKLDRIIQILESLTIVGKKPKKRISAKKTVSKKKKVKKPAKKKAKKTAKKKTKTKKSTSKKK